MTIFRKAGSSKAVLAGVAWIGISLGGGANAEQGEPRAVVEAFLAAVNEGDVDKVRGLLADDYQVLRRGAQCPEARSAAACEVEWVDRRLVQDGARLDVIDLRAEREIVRARLSVTGDSVRAARADRILVTKEFVVEDGHIVSILPTLHTDDPQTAQYRRRAVELP